jgi:hypothetical protein
MTTKENTIAKALCRAHAALIEDLRKLREAAEAGDIEEVRARLRATQKHIAEHFRFEEQGGYMDTVKKREPRLGHVIGQLHDEHRLLAQSLHGLIGEARASTTVSEAFRDKVRAWIEQVHAHEEREDKLVQDAFNLDLSAED